SRRRHTRSKRDWSSDVCSSDLGVGLGDGRVHVDYVGLNHLGWLRGLQVEGTDVLPRLLERADLIESFEEGRLFKADWIRTLGAEIGRASCREGASGSGGGVPLE